MPPLQWQSPPPFNEVAPNPPLLSVSASDIFSRKIEDEADDGVEDLFNDVSIAMPRQVFPQNVPPGFEQCFPPNSFPRQGGDNR